MYPVTIVADSIATIPEALAKASKKVNEGRKHPESAQELPRSIFRDVELRPGMLLEDLSGN